MRSIGRCQGTLAPKRAAKLVYVSRVCQLDLASFEEGVLLAATPCFHEARNVSGRCRSLTACPSAVRELKANMYPQLCGFSGGSRVPDVCCPGTAQEIVDNRVMVQPTNAAEEDEPAMSCKQYLQGQEVASFHQPDYAPKDRRPGALARRSEYPAILHARGCVCFSVCLVFSR